MIKSERSRAGRHSLTHEALKHSSALVEDFSMKLTNCERLICCCYIDTVDCGLHEGEEMAQVLIVWQVEHVGIKPFIKCTQRTGGLAGDELFVHNNVSVLFLVRPTADQHLFSEGVHPSCSMTENRNNTLSSTELLTSYTRKVELYSVCLSLSLCLFLSWITFMWPSQPADWNGTKLQEEVFSEKPLSPGVSLLSVSAGDTSIVWTNFHFLQQKKFPRRIKGYLNNKV